VKDIILFEKKSSNVLVIIKEQLIYRSLKLSTYQLPIANHK